MFPPPGTTTEEALSRGFKCIDALGPQKGGWDIKRSSRGLQAMTSHPPGKGGYGKQD